MSGKKEKHYSWGNNFHFLYGNMWKFKKTNFFFAVAEILFAVAVTFGGILIPSLFVGMLEQGISLLSLALQTLGIFVIYGGITAISSYLKNRNQFQYVTYRCGYIGWMHLKKCMTMDYVQYESEEGQKAAKKAGEAWGGNYKGVEGTLHAMTNLTTSLLGLFLYCMVISGASPWLLVMLFGISCAQMLSFRAANRYELKNKEKKAELEVTSKYLDNTAYDVAAGKDIRLYQMKEWLNGLYERVNRKYIHLVAKEKGCYFANDLFGLFLQFFRDVTCYGYLIYEMAQGSIAVSAFILYIGVVRGFSTYFSEITDELSKISGYQKEINCLREFLDQDQTFHHGEGEKLDPAQKALEISFSHVSFSYPGSEKKVLDDVSFTMKAGEKLALVGINGAGKTTIVKLICGFYQPTEGTICVNEKDLATLDLDDYCRYLAAVFQDAFVNSYTIANNVCCMDDGEYDEQKCMEVLEKAGLWEKVNSLTKRERTFLNKDVKEDGIQLSGGETQKLLLARALYKDGGLLLLDEPTAALDAIAENELYEKYREIFHAKTVLFISHRLASTRFCDRILFLENGRIVEEGTHEELLKREGAYAHMFEVQRQYYTKGGNTDENEECLA